MNNASIRTFFAIELPIEVQAKIINTLESIQYPASKSIKWVTQEQLHITLKFIGAFNPEHINPLLTKIQQEVINFHPFYIRLDHFGFFPNQKKPRVVWLGIHYSENINHLVRIIEKSTSAFGYPKESRAFHAHITLGRISYGFWNNEVEALSTYLRLNKMENVQVSVREVLFLKSDLKSTGPEYNKIFSIIL